MSAENNNKSQKVRTVFQDELPDQFIDFEIEVPWGQISCRWYGNNFVRPLLAIHGWMDNMGTFHQLIPLLTRHVGVLCIDLPGHGRSSSYPPGMQYSVLEWVSIIHRIVRHFQWPRVSLLGHSFGAVASNLYAGLYPQKVDMIIAMDLLMATFKSNDTAIKCMVHSTESMLMPSKPAKLYSKEDLPNIRWGPAPSVSRDLAQPLVKRCTVPAVEDPTKFYISRDSRLVHYTRFPDNSGAVIEANRRIRNIPYLVIRAKHSKYMDDSVVLVLGMLRKQNPAFEFHEVPGEHHVHITHPQQIAALIIPFINKYRPVENSKL